MIQYLQVLEKGSTMPSDDWATSHPELVHWLHQILQLPDSDLHRIIDHFDIDQSRLAADLITALDSNLKVDAADQTRSFVKLVSIGPVGLGLAWNKAGDPLELGRRACSFGAIDYRRFVWPGGDDRAQMKHSRHQGKCFSRRGIHMDIFDH